MRQQKVMFLLIELYRCRNGEYKNENIGYNYAEDVITVKFKKFFSWHVWAGVSFSVFVYLFLSLLSNIVIIKDLPRKVKYSKNLNANLP